MRANVCFNFVSVSHSFERDCLVLNRLIDNLNYPKQVSFFLEYDYEKYFKCGLSFFVRHRYNEFDYLIDNLNYLNIKYEFIDLDSSRLYDEFLREVSLWELLRFNFMSLKKQPLKKLKSLKVFYKKLILEREKYMFLNILKFSSTLNNYDVFVVVGEFHVNSLMQKLRKKGFSCKRYN